MSRRTHCVLCWPSRGWRDEATGTGRNLHRRLCCRWLRRLGHRRGHLGGVAMIPPRDPRATPEQEAERLRSIHTYPEVEWGIYCPSGCGLIFETQTDLTEHLERLPAHAGADS